MDSDGKSLSERARSISNQMGIIGNEDGIPCVLCDEHSKTDSEHNRHMEAVHGC